ALLALTVIGIAGGVAVAVGFLAQPLSDWTSPDTAFTAAGRVAGMSAGFLALLMLIFMARLPILEKTLGQDQLTLIHKKVGPYTLYLILAHVTFISVGYAELTNTNAWSEFWRLVFEAEKMLPAFIGLVMFFVVGVTSYRRARAKLKYETWWQIHFFSYLAVVLSFFHQVDTGVMFTSNPALKLWWVSYYALTFSFIIYYRWIQPARVSKRIGLELKEIIHESPTTRSLVFTGTNLVSLNAKPGQYLNFNFAGVSAPGTSHPFSLSQSPTENELRVTVKSLGDFTSRLDQLEPGTKVKISGPYGIFTASAAVSPNIVLVAGGIGITPIRALLDELSAEKNITLIWRSHSADDLPLESEIDELSEKLDVQIHKLIGPRSQFPLTPSELISLAPNIRSADIFICGPQGLIELIQKSAKALGVKDERIHAETFDL
ncbi:MAG: hypothetical protein RL038_438, partial [Actinomycetota bacterium]